MIRDLRLWLEKTRDMCRAAVAVQPLQSSRPILEMDRTNTKEVNDMTLQQKLAGELNLNLKHEENIVELIDAGNTIPFIARYRKELTGSIDDQVLRELADRLQFLRNLEARRSEVARLVEEQGKTTDAFSTALAKAETLAEIEDLYRPVPSETPHPCLHRP